MGIITDRDITIRAAAIGSEPIKAKVDEVMTPEVLCCLENDMSKTLLGSCRKIKSGEFSCSTSPTI